MEGFVSADLLIYYGQLHVPILLSLAKFFYGRISLQMVLADLPQCMRRGVCRNYAANQVIV